MWSWQKSLEFLSGRKVSLDDNFPKELFQPCFHKIKNIYELQSLMKKSLSSQELSLAEIETKVKELAIDRHEWLNFPSLSVQTASRSRPSDDHKWLKHYSPQISNLE